MWSNHMKLAFRLLTRNRVFSIVNVLGLALGIAASLLIFRFVQFEWSHDRGFNNADRVVRISTDLFMAGSEINAATGPWGLVPFSIQDFPEVETGTRVQFHNDVVINIDEQQRRFRTVGFTDSTFFEVFGLEFVIGDPRTVLSRPNTIVLTQSASARLFGDENPIGRTIRMYQEEDMEVTGIVRDLPQPNHMPKDVEAFLPIEMTRAPQQANVWFWIAYHNYLLLREGTDVQEFAAKYPDFNERHIGEYSQQVGMRLKFHVFPLKDLWLKVSRYGEAKPTGDINRVLMFSAIAIIILAIAIINFINLSTARSARRAKEVGIRKSVGALRSELIWQFFSETSLLVLISMGLAVLFAYLGLPWFNKFTPEPINLDMIHNPLLLAGLGGITLLVAICAGLLPTAAYTAFKPADVLKGQVQSGRTGQRIRQGLVVLQFTLSIFLIIGTLTAFHQMRYMMTRDLGFAKEQIMYLPLTDQRLATQTEAIKNKLKEHTGIFNAAAASALPGFGYMHRIFLPEGYADNEVIESGFVTVDHDFFDTFDLEITQGRAFDRSFATDEQNFILNESQVAKLEWEDPVGKGFDFPPRGAAPPGKVIGVIKDFNMRALHEPIDPMVFHLNAMGYRYLAIKFDPMQVDNVIDLARTIHEQYAPDWPFEYGFLDERFAHLYEGDKQFGLLFGSFTLLAILIASLGLFGLAAFVAEQKTKEIGVRKVLGANTKQIVALLSRDLMKWVLFANVLAWPLAWYAAHKWLQDFAYRVSPSLVIFLCGTLITLLIAFLTISGHAIKASHVNPVDSLRDE